MSPSCTAEVPPPEVPQLQAETPAVEDEIEALEEELKQLEELRGLQQRLRKKRSWRPRCQSPSREVTVSRLGGVVTLENLGDITAGHEGSVVEVDKDGDIKAQLIFHVDFDTLAPAGTAVASAVAETKYLTQEGACDTWTTWWGYAQLELLEALASAYEDPGFQRTHGTPDSPLGEDVEAAQHVLTVEEVRQMEEKAGHLLGERLKGCNEIQMLEDIGAALNLWTTFLVLGCASLLGLGVCAYLAAVVAVQPAVNKLMGGVGILTGIICLIIPAIAGAMVSAATEKQCPLLAAETVDYNGAGQCYVSGKGAVSVIVGLLSCILGSILIFKTVTAAADAKTSREPMAAEATTG
eukprot:Skav234866  [mRNA]  locus=scaffold840:295490:299139:- [translate_table: standard]